MKKRDTVLEHAIKAVGGPAALAKYITKNFGPISAQAICGWRRCPPQRVIQVEQATGGKIPRHRLRPDVFPA